MEIVVMVETDHDAAERQLAQRTHYPASLNTLEENSFKFS